MILTLSLENEVFCHYKHKVSLWPSKSFVKQIDFRVHFEPRFEVFKECMIQVTISKSQNFYRLVITT